jgi:hypothetical protein
MLGILDSSVASRLRNDIYVQALGLNTYPNLPLPKGEGPGPALSRVVGVTAIFRHN